MKLMNLVKEKLRGFTLIEALVFLFIFTLIVLTFYALFSTGTNQIIESKIKLMAVALANEKMEVVHNLDYADIGTESGIPSGGIPEREVINKSGRNFYVFTLVQYIDDSYDQTDGHGDLVPTDYKRVRIKASWEDDINSSKSVSFVANFMPPKKETPSGGGTLSINVLDKDGHGIPQATVHIVNTGKSINITTVTDNTGNISFPGAPADGQNYQISVSKSGYYSVQTYPPYPISSFDPDNEYAAVTEGRLNVTAIITDKSSDFNLLTEDPFGTSIPNIDFGLVGGKKIGKTVVVAPAISESVYNLDDDYDSGTHGKEEFQDQSYGPYTFTPDNSDYQFIKLDTAISEANKFEIEPDTDGDIKAIFADKNINSLLVKVVTEGAASPIEGVSVRLKNDTLGYDATLTTDKFGYAYFPSVLPELTIETYDLILTSSEYQEVNKTVDIDKLITENVSMTAI
jgi:hypothetical protein